MGTDQLTTEKPCPHGSMAPHWEKMEDFGKHDLMSYYICDACGIQLSREDGDRAMAEAVQTVRIDETLRKTTEEMLEGEKHGDV